MKCSEPILVGIRSLLTFLAHCCHVHGIRLATRIWGACRSYTLHFVIPMPNISRFISDLVRFMTAFHPFILLYRTFVPSIEVVNN